MKSFLQNIIGRSANFSSAEYWDKRYSSAGNSGAGSYGRLAEFKASVLNAYVADHGIARVLELGCGDGNQLSLANYENYVGLDISPTAVQICTDRFESNTHYRFDIISSVDLRALERAFDPQLVMSIDVLFHLVEDEIFHDYMTNLFQFERATVAIYSSNGNFNVSAPHIRNHKFTDWIAANAPEWELLEKVDNPYPWSEAAPDATSFCDFYFFRKGTT